jgi:glycosyltransferase involved in cell wall biosynthesis
MSNPTLTIGISFLNTADTLVDLVRCIYAQTFTDWELILVDDGSADGGADVVRRIADPRVRVIADGRNLGRSKRYNDITAIARGKYIARLDADDMCHPQRFEKQIAFLEQHPEVDAVSCDFLALNGRDEAMGRRAFKSVDIQHGGLLGRKEWFQRFPYLEDFRIAIDQALFMSAYRGSRLASLGEPLYYYRVLETYTLRKHYRGENAVMRLIWRYGCPHYPFYVTVRAILGRLLRLGAYAATEALGLRKKLLARRYAPVSAEDLRSFQEALSQIRATPVPGLDESGAGLRPASVTGIPFVQMPEGPELDARPPEVECILRGNFLADRPEPRPWPAHILSEERKL